MSNKWFWVLLVVFIVGGFTSGLLYRRYKVLVTQKPSEPRPPTQNFGSAVLTFSNPPPDRKEFLRSVVLNKLTVEDFNLDVIEVDGEKKPVLDLTISFDYQGKTRQLVIPIVDNILFSESGSQGFEKGEFVSVVSLNLEKGRMINVGFSYLPKESTTKRKGLVKYCGQADYQLCLKYIELGFGDNPVDFNAYLQSALGKQDTAQLDYKVSFPNTIFVLAN